jgi:hypothetical protein
MGGGGRAGRAGGVWGNGGQHTAAQVLVVCVLMYWLAQQRLTRSFKDRADRTVRVCPALAERGDGMPQLWWGK